MQTQEVRVRRPQRHEALIQQLRDDGVFSTMRDVLLFSAAVGSAQERRVPFDASNEPIRYETVTDPAFAETLINMIAAVAAGDDAEILDSSRIQERVTIFEEYANGGLEYLQEQMNTRQQRVELIVESLVTDALAGSASAEPVSVEELLDSTGW